VSDDVFSKYGINLRPAGDEDGGAYEPVPGHVAMLDLELPGGNRVAFPYATLMRIEFDPSDGILLRFATDDVRIEGRRLEELYRGLTQHRVPRVKATGSEHPVAGVDSNVDGGPVVTGIRWGPAAESTG